MDWSNASLRASGSAEREVWTGRTGRRRTTEENDKKRRFEIVILVLVALGALAAGAGIALYFAYPIRVETAAGEVRGYILSLNAPPGTVTTEENAAYKRGGAAPQAAAAAVPGAAAGDWPSYNKTLTSERFSDLSQINIANVAKLKVQCTYDTHQYSAFETGLIMVEGALIGTTEFDIFSINPARASRRRPPSTPARSYKSHSELTPKAGRPFHLSSQGEPGLASWHPEKRTSDRGKALGRPSCGDGRSKSRGMRLSAGLELGPRSLNLRAQLAKPPVIALRGAADRASEFERARFKPGDGRLAHAIRSREIRLRSAFPKPLERFLALVRCQRRGTPEFHATGLCTSTAIARASGDQAALKLGQATEHR